MAEVLVIDDGEVGRLGRGAALERAGHRPTAMGWEEAGRLAAETGAKRFDLVLAACRPNPTSWDRYPVVATLPDVRRAVGTRTRIVALLWGSAMDNPLLGRRLAVAGVNRVVDAAEACCGERLDRMVTDRRIGRDPEPTAHELSLLGVGANTDPDAMISWVMANLADPGRAQAYRNAFEAGFAQNTCGLSRRQAYSLRLNLSRAGHIHAGANRSAGGPVRAPELPRWGDVVAITNVARGLDAASERSAQPVEDHARLCVA